MKLAVTTDAVLLVGTYERFQKYTSKTTKKVYYVDDLYPLEEIVPVKEFDNISKQTGVEIRELKNYVALVIAT